MIKAICDWADTNKNDKWQEYAAHSSAAFAVLLLEDIAKMAGAAPPSNVPDVAPERKTQVDCIGPDRFEICERLEAMWEDIADYYEITPRERARFRRGRGCFTCGNGLRIGAI
jgi:bDLD-like protein